MNPDAAVGAAGALRIAVTGSSGFVGRHLVPWLQQRGHRVRCLSRQAQAIVGSEHRQVQSYLDVPALAATLVGCDGVVHLAARAHVLQESDAAPEQAFRISNHDSAVAMAQAAKQAGVRRFVLLSSIGVNGQQTSQRPFTANDLPAPAEPYAVSKWQAEQGVAAALAKGPTGLVILRPTLVYGADCPGNFRLLLNLVHRLPIVPLGGLHRPRSLIHIDNLCHAIAHACLHPGAAGHTFLLSDGVDLSVAQVVAALARAFGKPPGRVWALPEALLRLAATAAGRRQAWDKLAGALVVDASAFTTATGWQPPLAPAQALAQTASAYLADQRS